MISIDEVDPVSFFGAGNENLNMLGNLFPQVKVVARGNQIQATGEPERLDQFELAIERLIHQILRYGELRQNQIERIVLEGYDPREDSEASSEVLVHGNQGRMVKARTTNQRKMVEEIGKNDLLFAIGPAGTGKTYTAVALAVRALKNKEVKRIILCRPAVEAGESLGFLPGDLKDKLDPYLRPLYDALRDMIHPEKLKMYFEHNVVEIAPLAFMRGRTLDHAFVILDEAQNATSTQLKMFLTRMGKSAKFVVTGDMTQIDLPRKVSSGLPDALDRLGNLNGISVVRLNDKDVIRHKLVNKIISAYRKPQDEAEGTK